MTTTSTASRRTNVKTYVRLRPADAADDDDEMLIQPLDNGTTCRVHNNWSDSVVETDGIFAETILSPQQQLLHNQLCQQITQDVCDGYNSCVIAYGPQQSGKSYSLFDRDNGVVSKVVDNLFRQLSSNQSWYTECLIQCSIAQVYLESVRDVLGEASRTTTTATTTSNKSGLLEPRIHRGALVGCTALCCLTKDDVLQVVARGLEEQQQARLNALENHHQHQESTFVVQLTVQIGDESSSEKRFGRLLFVDCAPSQYTSTEENNNDDGEWIHSESMMALHNYVRDLRNSQQQQQQQQQPSFGPNLSHEAIRKLPLINQLLLYSFGANSLTHVIVCVSPSLQVSQQSIQFGMDCRNVINEATPNVNHSWPDCLQLHRETEERLENMELVTRALAAECVRLRGKGHSNPLMDKQLWSIIEKISQCEQDERKIDFMVATKTEHEQKRETMKLRSDLRRSETERDKAIAKAARVKAESHSIKEQAKQLNHQYRQLKLELETIRVENIALKQRALEGEHNLRTSLFRESEAVVFLRQFRKFYFRLLHKMAKEGSGDIYSVIAGIPGAPDLDRMVDMDRMMVESGLLEEDEINKENAIKDCRPSQAALSRSSAAVADAENILSAETNGNIPPAGMSHVQLSILKRSETGEATEARQRLFQTPSGRYIEMRETELEAEILKLSEQCMVMQARFQEEKDNAASLVSNSGTQHNLEVTREINALQDKLKRKEKDWQAVILKMNELHLSSKDSRDRLDNREQHVLYLESALAEAQQQYFSLAMKMEAVENSPRNPEQLSLKTPLWQFEEPGSVLPALSSRFVIPFVAGSRGLLKAAHDEMDHQTSQTPFSTEGSAKQDFDSLSIMNHVTGSHNEPHNTASEVDIGATDTSESGFVSTSVNGDSSSNLSPSKGHSESQTTSNGPFATLSALRTASPAPAPAPAPAPDDKPKSNGKSVLERLQARARAEAEAEKSQSEDEKVPEWMRKFRVIGAKNANEQVLETQGAAGVREFGRTPWEALKLHDHKATDATEIFTTTTVNWQPRRAKQRSGRHKDDNKNNSPSNSENGSDCEDEKVPQPVTTSASENEKASGVVDLRNKLGKPQAPATMAPQNKSSDSDSDSDLSDERQPRKSPFPPPVLARARVQPIQKTKDSDSDSSDSSAESPPKASPPPVAGRAAADSDSDSDSSEDSPIKKAFPPSSKARDSDLDSDSSDDRATRRLPTKSMPAKKQDSDSDESDSSDDSPPRKSQVAPPQTHIQKTVPAAVASVPPKKHVPSDSDSDSDSSSKEELQQKQPTSKPKAFALSSSLKQQDSDDSDSEKDTPTTTTPSLTTANQPNDDDDARSSSSNKNTKFVIVNGKLIVQNGDSSYVKSKTSRRKQDTFKKAATVTAATTTQQQKPAFVIVNGKLVKTDGSGEVVVVVEKVKKKSKSEKKKKKKKKKKQL